MSAYERIDVRRVLIVANPAARGFSRRKLDAVCAALAQRGVQVETRLSAARGDISAIAAAEGEAFDVIAVHGGDGTINEAVSGIRDLARQPALAILAGGTANVLALETGAGRAADVIARDIAGGATAPLYYGLANGEPFVLMASVGVDAAVVRQISSRLKRVVGRWAYIFAGLAQQRRPRTPDLRVIADGRAYSCRLAVCANAARYGGAFVIAPETSALQDGLRLLLVEDDSLSGLLRIGRRLLAGGDLAAARVVSIDAREIEIAAEPCAPVQIDGDAACDTPLRVVAASVPVRLIVAAE